MYKILSKYGMMIAFSTGALISIILMIMFASVDGEMDIYNEEVQSATGVGMWVAYILGGICVAAAILLPLFSALGEPKKLMGPGIGVLVLGLVYLISWSIAGDEVVPKLATDFGITPGISKAVGGMIISMYIMFVLTICAWVYSAVSKLWN